MMVRLQPQRIKFTDYDLCVILESLLEKLPNCAKRRTATSIIGLDQIALFLIICSTFARFQ